MIAFVSTICFVLNSAGVKAFGMTNDGWCHVNETFVRIYNKVVVIVVVIVFLYLSSS